MLIRALGAFRIRILMVSFNLAREKPKVVKRSDEANDGPEAKKPKVDPSETTMVKKVCVKSLFGVFFFLCCQVFTLAFCM